MLPQKVLWRPFIFFSLRPESGREVLKRSMITLEENSEQKIADIFVEPSVAFLASLRKVYD